MDMTGADYSHLCHTEADRSQSIMSETTRARPTGTDLSKPSESRKESNTTRTGRAEKDTVQLSQL